MNIHERIALQREAVRLDQAAGLNLQDRGEARHKEYRRRHDLLINLRELIIKHDKAILGALTKDLGKSAGEGYMSEVGIVLGEIRYLLKHLKKWMKPIPIASSLAVFPSRSMRCPEPYGLVLIMSPWNYPFQLTMLPLIGAIAAGNRCIVKPSSQSPATSRVMAEIISAWAPPELVSVVQGSHQQWQQLLDERFDYIFFTGSPVAGRYVMKKAAEHLTPLTLELGGKSPCIVDETADLELAARRIAFGKAINAGQTCVAPDYLLVHSSVKDKLLALISQTWESFYGKQVLASADWPRIIGARHYSRLMELLRDEDVYCGGVGDGERIAPTLLDNVSWNAPVMREEIFGPILPVISYSSLQQAADMINKREKPLALYLFSQSDECVDAVVRAIPFGGGCVNDTLIQLGNPRLPFGGIGSSGMGSYHGKQSFDTFTHYKSVMRRGKPDFPFRYPPYTDKKLSLLRQFLK